MFRLLEILHWNLLAINHNTEEYFQDILAGKFVVDGFWVEWDNNDPKFPCFIVSLYEPGMPLEITKLSTEEQIDLFIKEFAEAGIDLVGPETK